MELLLEHEELLHAALGWAMIATGAVVFAVERAGFFAPYGRYSDAASASWFGPRIPARLAWFVQESWAFLVPLALLPLGDGGCVAAWPNRALLGMFMTHYFYRTFVFPLRMRGGKAMPVGLCALASLFCLGNGYLQGRLWTQMTVRAVDTPADAARFAAGAALWAAGFWINLDSDHRLRTLRRPGESGYKVPRGGAFEYVSGANYFGEIVEWCGYALAANRLGATAFAVFTFCNTAPRAHTHHEWYRQKFDDYPPERKAVIPWLW